MAKRFLIISLFLAFLVAAQNAGADEPHHVSKGVLCTKDNVAIAYERYEKGSDAVVIICPGFYNSKDNRWMRKTAEMTASEYDVIIFDFRGHGKSGGRFTWSAKEYLDVEAVIDYTSTQGYSHIGILGFSLGAASALAAASERGGIESMVLISTPYDFTKINFNFWEPAMFADLKDNIDCKWQGKGAAFGLNIFRPKPKPVDAVRKLKDTAILFIHGDRDWVIKPRHSKKLYEAAPGRKRLEIIKGGMHAERMIEFNETDMRRLILEWFAETLK